MTGNTLALGESAERVERLYEDSGRGIFTRQARDPAVISHWLARFLVRLFGGRADRLLARFDLDVDYLLQSKYDSVLLRSALNDAFGTKKLGDAVTRLVLPAVDLSAGRIVVMKTPHLPHASSRDRHYGAVDAVLSTTAAPTYFPHASITAGSSYCDGGLRANNPTMVAYAEAMKIRECCKRAEIDASFEPDEIWVLSVGTGITNYSLAPPRKNAGLAWWAPRLLNTTLLSQSQGTEALANYMIGSPRHHRVNFALPDESWKLDCVDRLDTLKHIGYRTAHEQLAFVREQFLYEPAVPYTPFGGEPALSTATK